MSKLKYLFLLTLFAAANAYAQTSADRTAIERTALDYIEGWYTGDAERMERALHPELAKRMVSTNIESGRSFLDQQSAMALVQNTRAGGGRRTPEARRLKEVTILDIYENAAAVRIDASDWIDYLHLARWNDTWKIVNVLWELRPLEE